MIGIEWYNDRMVLMPISRCVRFFLIVSLCFSSLVPVPLCFGAFSRHSEAQWEQILKASGLAATPELVKKLAAANDAIEKIDSQTKGNLHVLNWMEVFRKLDVQPAATMSDAQWQTFFAKAGIPAVDLAVEEPADVATPATPIQAVSAPLQSDEPPKAVEGPVVVPPPPPPPRTAQANESSDKTSLISLDLKDADIFTALKIISKQTGMSIVASNNVRGTVTLYLQSVNALDALRMILEMNGLAYVREGMVYKITTASDYERMYGKRFFDTTEVDIVKFKYAKAANIERALSSLKSSIGQIIPDTNSNSIIVIDTLQKIEIIKNVAHTLDVRRDIKSYSLNYAKAKDVSEKVKSSLTSGIGEIQTDERSNQLIITDVPEKLGEIDKIVASLDRRHKEVLIEAKIIQVILGNDFKMGINWASVFNKVNNTVISGSVGANLGAISPGSPGIRLSVGTLAVDNFTAVYDFLQTVGKTNIVSSPKIATIDGQEAKILVGTKEAYVTTTVTTPGTGATTTAESVTFIDVGVKLFATPMVGDDGYVTMKIRPEVSSVDRTLATAQGNSIPIVRTSESETTIMVKDGVTIVIGGLMEERKEKQVSGVPLLSKIPLLGSLFGRTSYVNNKIELAVFLTPRIISGDSPSEDKPPKT